MVNKETFTPSNIFLHSNSLAHGLTHEARLFNVMVQAVRLGAGDASSVLVFQDNRQSHILDARFSWGKTLEEDNFIFNELKESGAKKYHKLFKLKELNRVLIDKLNSGFPHNNLISLY